MKVKCIMKFHVDKRVKAVLMAALFLVASCSVPLATKNSTPATQTLGINLNTETPSSSIFTPTGVSEQIISPTLSSSQISETVRDLYAHNSVCELPCLWGIVPGKTSFQDVYGQFSQIGTFRDITRSVDNFQTVVLTVLPPSDLMGIYNDNTWSFHLRLVNNVVVGILTGVTVIEEFSNPSISNFFFYFGRPEEIRVRVIESMLIEENPDYEIAVYYPTKGVFIRWRGETESVVAQTEKSITVMACPQYMPTQADTLKGSYPPFFYLFSPDKDMPFDEIIEKHLSEDPNGSYQLLDNEDIDNFYTMYSDAANQECFPLTYSFLP